MFVLKGGSANISMANSIIGSNGTSEYRNTEPDTEEDEQPSVVASPAAAKTFSSTLSKLARGTGKAAPENVQDLGHTEAQKDEPASKK